MTPSMDTMSPKSHGSWIALGREATGPRISWHVEHLRSLTALMTCSGQLSCLQDSLNLMDPGCPRLRCSFNSQFCSSDDGC